MTKLHFKKSIMISF